MGWLSVLLSGIAAFLLFKAGHTVLMILAILAAVGCFWSWGIMHNYATDLAKRRSDYTGGFYDITNREAQAVPDWISTVNMVFSLAGLVLLITGIVMMVRK
jgi:uncharacterized membrane-anchored protein